MNLAYLEKVPKEYFCTYTDQPEPTLCYPIDFCTDPTVTSYTPNMALSDSYENWVGRLDLACASKAKVSFIGAIYFIGWILTLLFIPRISDLYGRQKILIGGISTQTLAYAFLVFNNSYVVTVGSLFVLGMCSAVRTQVAYIYMYENMRPKHYERTTGIIHVIEGTLAVFGALYFFYISKYWFPLIFGGFMLSVFGNIGVWFYYESPRYLIKSGQIQKA